VTPADLLLICDDAGDLWRVFPGGKFWPIRSEDDLGDVDRISNLPPEGSMRSPAGDLWRRIRYVKCRECDGDGDVPEIGNDGEPVYEIDYETDEETGAPIKCGCQSFVTCDDCRGEGWLYTWTDEFVRAVDVAKEAA